MGSPAPGACTGKQAAGPEARVHSGLCKRPGELRCQLAQPAASSARCQDSMSGGRISRLHGEHTPVRAGRFHPCCAQDAAGCGQLQQPQECWPDMRLPGPAGHGEHPTAAPCSAAECVPWLHWACAHPSQGLLPCRAVPCLSQSLPCSAHQERCCRRCCSWTGGATGRPGRWHIRGPPDGPASCRSGPTQLP